MTNYYLNLGVEYSRTPVSSKRYKKYLVRIGIRRLVVLRGDPRSRFSPVNRPMKRVEVSGIEKKTEGIE